MSRLNKNTGFVLEYGVAVSIAVLIVGAILSLTGANISEGVLLFGTYMLVLVPFASIIVSTVTLYAEKDMHWFKVCVLLLMISIAGMIFAYVR